MKLKKYMQLILVGLFFFNTMSLADDDIISGVDNQSTSPESSSPNTTNIISITPSGFVRTSVPDSTINMNVQTKLNNNPLFNASGLTATTSSGTVKLQGHVNTQADLIGAVNAVRSVEGVVSVDISSVTIGTETSSPSGESSSLTPESSY